MDNPNYVDDLEIGTIFEQSAEMLLESLSLEIMEASINEQITSGGYVHRDFLEMVLLKFRAIEENATADNIRHIKGEIIAWAEKLNVSIVNRFGLAYMCPSEDSTESLDILESLYNFFILDRHRNVISFFSNYIERNKTRLIEVMDLDKKGGDITSIANKKRNLSKSSTIISANLAEVIQYIVEYEEVSPETFLDTVDDGDLFVHNIRQYFDVGTLAGNFFSAYVEDEVGSYTDDMSVELRATIRTLLLSDIDIGG